MPIFPSSAAAARNFSRAAEEYNTWAIPQREAARRLVGMIPAAVNPRRFADLGCGTGFLTDSLLERYPRLKGHLLDIAPGMIGHCRRTFAERAGLEFLVGDAAAYTPGPGVDLVASSFSLQWMTPLGEVLERWMDLPGGGHLALALPVDGSLAHLDSAHREALGRPVGGLGFPGEQDVVGTVEDLGGRILAREACDIGFRVGDGLEALRALRAIGAGARGHGGYVPLTPAETRHLANVYTTRHRNGKSGVPVEYRVLHLVVEVST